MFVGGGSSFSSVLVTSASCGLSQPVRKSTSTGTSMARAEVIASGAFRTLRGAFAARAEPAVGTTDGAFRSSSLAMRVIPHAGFIAAATFACALGTSIGGLGCGDDEGAADGGSQDLHGAGPQGPTASELAERAADAVGPGEPVTEPDATLVVALRRLPASLDPGADLDPWGQ